MQKRNSPIKDLVTRKRFLRLPLAYCLLLTAYCSLPIADCKAQNGKQKIAVFAPLYLDSAFDAGNTYRYDKAFPKFINPGLEFYEGIQLALDSLDKENVPLEIFVFDTRSSKTLLQEQLNGLDSVGLIIAHANAQENWVLADEARIRKVPYINVNLPNDGGITNNPYFVMLNPSLKTHVEAVYRYLQRYYSTNSITVLRKQGQMEDLIHNYIEDFSKSTASVPLKLKYVDLVDSFTLKQVLALLDSNRQNVFLSASLSEINLSLERLEQQLVFIVFVAKIFFTE